MKLDNRSAVVTGGASGIGRATCLALAEAGARVFIGDLNQANAEGVVADIRAAGGVAEAIPLDVAKDASVAEFAHAVHNKAGKVDIVVNCAGWMKTEPFVQNTPAHLDEIVAINLLGPAKVTQAFLERMIEAKYGKIINIASDAGRVGQSGQVMYAAAKGGVIALTKSLARELARYDINVNCVCPGLIDTPLLQGQTERTLQPMLKAVPFHRLGKASEVADAVLFLASERSSYVTGQVLSVSGGATMAG